VDRILLGHGSGGSLMHDLIAEHFAPPFGMTGLLADAAVLDGVEGRLAMCTDSYVVSPIFFPGGDIGELAHRRTRGKRNRKRPLDGRRRAALYNGGLHHRGRF
jgi:hydrogenase maturation factor